MLGLSDSESLGLIVTVVNVLMAWMGWKVAVKAGYSGVYGLICLVPLGIVAFLSMLAFNEWPVSAGGKSAVTPDDTNG